MSDRAAPPVHLRPEILALPAYRQGKVLDGGFKLSSNENPYEPLPGVLDAVREAAGSFNRYPESSAPEVTEALAARYDLAPERVVVAAGGMALLTQLVIAAAGAGDQIVYAWRSFEAYPWLPTLTGAVSVRVPLRADGTHDLVAMADAVTDRTRLVIVCSPNNPTSTVVTASEFEAFMDAVPGDLLVVLDEAYAEFVTDPDAVRGRELLDRYPNLVVLRTFSKAYGLAGLRIGYGMGHEAVLEAVRTTAIPLSLTRVAQVAALSSLDHDAELRARVDAIVERRDALWADLVGHGWEVPKPQGNFVWLPTGESTDRAVEILAGHGLVGRPFHPEGIRISVGEHESVLKLLQASEDLVRNLTKLRS